MAERRRAADRSRRARVRPDQVTGRLSISDSSVGRIRSVGVPVCPARLEAIGAEGKARAATIRRTLLRVMLWVWLGSGPLAALGLLLYFVLRADAILWVFVAIPGLLSAGVMLGLPPHLLFSPGWGRHWAITKRPRVSEARASCSATPAISWSSIDSTGLSLTERRGAR